MSKILLAVVPFSEEKKFLHLIFSREFDIFFLFQEAIAKRGNYEKFRGYNYFLGARAR
jgi:hypothetical protein